MHVNMLLFLATKDESLLYNSLMKRAVHNILDIMNNHSLHNNLEIFQSSS